MRWLARVERKCVEEEETVEGATEAVAIGEALALVSREDLRQNVRDSFIDEEI